MIFSDDLDRPAVRQRLVDGEIQTGVGRLHRRTVERTAPILSLCPSARRADVGRPIGSIPHEQELDTTVRGSLQCLLPPGRGAAVPRSLLAPAREQLVLTTGTPALEQRPSRVEQPWRIDVRLGRGPTEQCRPHLG